ncbi:LamG domain-containing protein [Paeniglutamicibacter antarcticus]|uniref:PKD repeat protein n=1 Tax=Paeniglutamicibacter antarcticus TaxID=494023 RepID=A0ABP9TNE3_9MICC
MKSSNPPNSNRRTLGWKTVLSPIAALSMIATGLLFVPAAAADEIPTDLPQTVSADSIPTPQINGVAWDLRVKGNVAYVVGSFTRARPSGVAAGGAGEVVRNNGMSFNIATGQILPWNPNFNAPVLDIEFSPDESAFYTAGQFTGVGGQARSKVASFNASNGALTGFATSVGGHVETLAVTNEAVYIGGSFNSIGSETRRNLAKFDRSTADLQGWNPIVDDIVHGIIATNNSDRVVIGGRFQRINGETKVGVGAVDKDSGDQVTWSSTPIPARISDGQRAWVVDLKLENGVIYAANNGMGWHWFDGRWAADYETGDLVWLDNCYGSTSSVSVMGEVLYSTPHAHDCSPVNGFPEENPMIWKRALAETTFATGIDQTSPSNNSLVRNQPIPTLLHWYPSVNTGFYTGQYQGGWAMDNNGDYLVMGGEFTRINNVNQQGLAVFPKREISPNKQRPEYTPDLKPTAISQGSNTARIAWPTTWDYDDETLTYEVLRDNSLTALDSQDAASIWWKPQSLGFRDTTVAAGSTHTYRIRVSDPWGNNYIGPRSDPITVSNTPVSPFKQALQEAGAKIYYPLNEPDGRVVFDNLGFVDADASANLDRSVSGAIEGDDASGFNGQNLASRTTISGPNTFALQAWFKTDTSSGGKLIGFGNARTGNSSSYDRHVWMDNSGKLHFGTWIGSAATVSSSNSYNDNEWHQVVVSLSPGGMNLYVDGLKVAERADVSSGQDYSGVWRIGGDNMNGWPNQPSSTSFNGTLDEVAIFDEPLGDQKVLELFQASGRTADIPLPPADAYGMSVYEDQPQFYWRFDEESGQVAKDQTIAKNDGTIHGQVALDKDPAITQGRSFGFGNADAVVVANGAQNNPSVFSTEAWFKTTSGSGGKIVGFGNAASGQSSSYDRHVFMRDDGTLVFGTYTGVENIADTDSSYNDGDWHHVVASLSADGMKLYVDGSLQASNPQTSAEPYTGFWRVGGDRVWGGASSAWFDGEIDEVAVYPRALSQSEVNDHYSVVGSANQDPVAEFTSAGDGLDVAFDASASTDPDGSILEYSWDFGDGSSQDTSTEGTTHLYAEAGTFTVTLTVTDDRGSSSQVSNQITVQTTNEAPTAAMSTSQTGLLLEVDGTESTDADGQIASYEWDFGDGTPTVSGDTATHVFARDGEFTVTLTVTDDHGDTGEAQAQVTVANAAPQAAMQISTDGLNVSVDGSDSSDPEGEDLEYAWEFGDGTTANGVTANHVYAGAGEYTISLVVTDAHGAEHTATGKVTVQIANTVPVAAFGSVVSGLQVSFDAGASSDIDGEIVSYEWDFGDETQDSGVRPTHAYAASGSFEVTLTVTDDAGANHSVSAEIQVQDPAELDPTAAFTASVQAEEVTVDASGSIPPEAGGDITGYAWDFGDGTTGEGMNASHTYTAPGTYSITLTVSAGTNTNSVTQNVSISQADGPTPRVSTELSGWSLAVDASSSTAGDAPITSYAWDFGDDATGSGAQAEHRYDADGDYTVTLTVTDGNSLSSSTSVQLTVVNDLPVAAFTVDVDALDIVVDASASNDANGEIASYSWDFGDGTEDSGVTANHSYAGPGNFQVRLTVTDIDGGSASFEQSVQVTEVPLPQVLVRDDFARSVSNAWGAADEGGTWNTLGSAANFTVSDGQGLIRMATSGSGPRLNLPVEIREADLSIKLELDKPTTGGGVYQYVAIRDIPNVGSYRLKVRTLSNGAVAATFERIVGGSVVGLTPETTIGQVQGGPDDPIMVRLQVIGTDTSELSAKVYPAGSAEPATWQLTAGDSTAALQQSGRIGLAVYLSGSATNAPIMGGFGELLVTEVP